MSTFVGIDLGTTNSVVAHRNRYGRPEVIVNREGQNITPSVVYFGTDPPAVGQEAKEWARLGDAEIASFFKPHMGSPLYQLQFHGKTYSATELSTLVLKRLKADAELALGQSVDRAVITVPAYFGDAQRKATIEAGNAAGFQVMRIINEPTAATLAYGLNRTGTGKRNRPDLRPGRRHLRRDRRPDRRPRTSPCWPPPATMTWAARTGTTGSPRSWPNSSPPRPASIRSTTRSRSTRCCFAASRPSGPSRSGTSTRITLQLGSRRQSFELSRSEFEAMSFPLMDRTRRLTEEALGEARLDWQSLDGVLLVGGSTRMPMVRSYVTEMAGKPPRTGVNVDEVVALGAAIQAAIEVGQPIGDALPKFTLSTGPARGNAAADGRTPRHGCHVAQPGDRCCQPRCLQLRQRRPDPPQHPDSGAEHQDLYPRHARRGQYPARSLPDPGREHLTAGLHDPGEVRLHGNSRHGRRGDGRRGHLVRRQRRGPGAGRPARHGAQPGRGGRARAR